MPIFKEQTIEIKARIKCTVEAAGAEALIKDMENDGTIKLLENQEYMEKTIAPQQQLLALLLADENFINKCFLDNALFELKHQLEHTFLRKGEREELSLLYELKEKLANPDHRAFFKKTNIADLLERTTYIRNRFAAKLESVEINQPDIGSEIFSEDALSKFSMAEVECLDDEAEHLDVVGSVRDLKSAFQITNGL